MPVSSERYWQWVIEDRFIAGRPDWERVGVQLVKDVGPYEEAKIRILNAGHSGLAWLGTLAGLRFIHEAARDQAIRRAVRAFITDDVIPGLEADGAGPIDLQAYRDTVLDRFGNVALGDTLERVASDSFAKVPGFFARSSGLRAPASAADIDGAAAIARTHLGLGLGSAVLVCTPVPADVALPADARILTSMTLGANTSVSLHSPRSLALVFEEFRTAQRAAAWSELEARERPPVQSLGFRKDGRRLEADFVAEPGGGTTVAVSVRSSGG